MKAVIVYESHFGQTREIAEAVAAGVREVGVDVVVRPVAEAPPDLVEQADLLVVGGPTHVRGMSRPWSRGKAEEAHETPDHEEPSDGVREWLERLRSAATERRAAAFDTRLPASLAGGAAHGIARRLRRHGFSLVAEPEGFLVDEAQGPLRQGERDRAQEWGAGLAGSAARHEK